jgi:alkylhydroperoxidase family enzyme
VAVSARIQRASAPFDQEVAELIDRTMKGQPPLQLFTTLARDPRLAKKFFAGGLLDKGNLTIRQREIVIDRTTALCRSEYEWGLHIAVYAAKAGLTEEQVRSTASGSADDSCWTHEDRLLIRLCDTLHQYCNIDDELWAALRTAFTENAILELLMLAGFYRTVSYLTNGLRLPLESAGARFPAGDGSPPCTATTSDTAAPLR